MVIDMICKNCDSELRDGSVFCTNCGTRLEAEPAVAVPQPPSADSITVPEVTAVTDTPIEQPQMPEIPSPPAMPVTLPPDPVTTPAYDAPVPDTPDIPAPAGHVTPVTPNPFAPPPPASQPSPPSQPPVSSGQVSNPFAPPPARAQGVPFASPGGPKKSKAGLVIGMVIGGIVLFVLGIFIGFAAALLFESETSSSDPRHFDSDTINIQPPDPVQPTEMPAPPVETPGQLQPPPPPPPRPSISNNGLAGLWEFDNGDYLWFFGKAEHIIVIENEDGTFIVSGSGEDEWGDGHIDDEGFLVVTTDWGVEYKFSFLVIGDHLTLTDDDGDMSSYNRIN